MPTVSITIRHNGPVAFQTTDPTTVAALREALTTTLPEGYTGPTDTILVPAHDLVPILKAAGRNQWSSVVETEEEASMVRVEFA